MRGQPASSSPASGRGRDERGFRRGATNPLHLAVCCNECARVATVCHMSPWFVTFPHEHIIIHNCGTSMTTPFVLYPSTTYLVTYLPNLPTCLPTFLPAYLPTYQVTHLLTYLPNCLTSCCRAHRRRGGISPARWTDNSNDEDNNNATTTSTTNDNHNTNNDNNIIIHDNNSNDSNTSN